MIHKHDSKTYSKMDVTRKGISRILELREILLSFQTDFIIIIINPLTARVVGAPQMILPPVFSIFSLFPTALWDLPNSRPAYFLMLSSSLFFCLVFFPILLCLARWFWPDLMNGRHDHTTAVSVSLRSSGSLRVVRLSV